MSCVLGLCCPTLQRMAHHRSNLHPHGQQTSFAHGSTFPDLRGGTRVPCNIPVQITNVNGIHWFSEQGVVILANPLGCAVRFRCPVQDGTTVLLEGLPSVGMATARVVNCISLDNNLWVLGLALDKPGNVWGTPSPPEDWHT